MKDQIIHTYQYNAEINTSEPAEVQYWTKRFNVSSQQLVGAIKATKSSSVMVIEEYLFNRKTRQRRPRFIVQV